MATDFRTAQQGQSTLEQLVDELVRGVVDDPRSVRRCLHSAFDLPVAVYAQDIRDAADRLRRTARPTASKPAVPGRVWVDGWRQQLPGSWPYYPDEPHYCHPAGHWTRDGSQLVLACCGLDAT